jgi:hypothetical protein
MKFAKKEMLITGLAGAFIITIAVSTTYLIIKNNQTAKVTNVDISTTTSEPLSTTAQDCVGDSCLAVAGLEYPAGELPVVIADSVRSALDDEYKASTAYNAIISKIGSVRPFSMIIRAEESHIAQLKSLLDKYGEVVPENPYIGKITPAATKQENCQIGVDAEISNIALYRDKLLPAVTDYPDITTVFNSLMVASRDKHLPSFEQCN